MPAIDFFHVDCAVTLRRLYVLIALEVDDRYLHVGAAIAEEDPPWLALRDHYCLDPIRSSMSREGTARQAVAGVGLIGGGSHRVALQPSAPLNVVDIRQGSPCRIRSGRSNRRGLSGASSRYREEMAASQTMGRSRVRDEAAPTVDGLMELDVASLYVSAVFSRRVEAAVAPRPVDRLPANCEAT